MPIPLVCPHCKKPIRECVMCGKPLGKGKSKYCPDCYPKKTTECPHCHWSLKVCKECGVPMPPSRKRYCEDCFEKCSKRVMTTYMKKYRQTDKYKAYMKKYRSTDKYKKAMMEYQANYRAKVLGMPEMIKRKHKKTTLEKDSDAFMCVYEMLRDSDSLKKQDGEKCSKK